MSGNVPESKDQGAPAINVAGEDLVRRQGAGLQAALITISAVSLFAGITVVSRLFGCVGAARCSPSSPWMSLVVLYALLPLEGIYTTRWLNAPERRHVEKLPYRLSEFLTVIIVVRLFTWTLAGSWPRMELLESYLNYPLFLFNDTFFVIGVLLVGFAWIYAIGLENVFGRLAIDAAEAAYYSLPLADREPGKRPMSVDRSRLVASLMQQWMWGNIILIICTAITTFDFSGFELNQQFRSITRSPLSSDSIVALMGYILSGLLLLSQARMATMKARWLIAGAVVSPRVRQSWHRNSLGLVVVVALLAAFLPLGSTFAVGPILRAIAQGVFTIFGTLAALFFALVSLLFPRVIAPASQRTAPTSPINPSGLPASEPNELVGLILSSMFWALAIFAAVTALTFFLRDRGFNLKWSVLHNAWLGIRHWLKSLWQDLSVQATQIRRALPVRRRSQPASLPISPNISWKLIRFNRLTSREQIRYLFLSITRKAGEKGIVRRLSETPSEYVRKLKEEWPEAATDLQGVTSAFLKARYSIQSIENEEVRAVMPAWRRLKRLIRRRRGRDKSTEEPPSTSASFRRPDQRSLD